MACIPSHGSRSQTEHDFAEYDPTPFSGGYDQSAFYGRPKPPSDETCYPISAGKPSYAAGRVDEQRPTYVSQRPPQQSSEGFYSGYGKPKPSYGGGYEPEEGHGFGRPKPVYQGSFGSGGGEEGFESGYGRPPASYGGRFGSDDSYERPHAYGKPHIPEQSYELGYGGGFGDSYGVSNEQSEESYGGFGGNDYGRKKPGHHGSEDSKYASGGRRKQDEEGEFGSGGRWRKEEEYKSPGYGEGFKEPSAGEWGSGYAPPPPEEEGYGGRNRPSGHRWGEGGLSSATESLSLGSEGHGSYEGHHGHKHQKHHWHHHDDDE